MSSKTIAEPSLLLLRFAIEKDNIFRKSIVRNYAVIACLSYAERLHEISHAPENERLDRLSKLLKSDQIPVNFLVLVTVSLRTISNRINEMIRSKNTTDIPLTTDFDSHALKAFGLAFSEIMWLPKEKNDFSGPLLKACLSRLQLLSLQELWSLFTKHYFGNILQHYFDEAGLRRNPELRNTIPADEEDQLRQRDGAAIAQFAMDQLQTKSAEELNIFDYIDLLVEILKNLVKK